MSAEGYVEGESPVGIDLDGPRFEGVRNLVGPADLPGQDTGCESVASPVLPDHLPLILEGNHSKYRAEDLLPRDPRPVAYLREDGRLYEVAVL